MQPKDFDLLRPSAKARLILAVVGGVLLAWLLVSRKPWTISVPDSGAWRLSDYVAVYVWIAALINLVLVTLLALTAHWWTRPLLNVRLSSAPEPGRYPSRCESLGERSEGLCLRVLCLIPLVIFCLLCAVKNGRWLWWAAFGIAAFFLMYFYPTCVYVMIRYKPGSAAHCDFGAVPPDRGPPGTGYPY
jgi:hypothetical protein